jgi:peptide/nickel transport system substrate-binding protein
MLVAGLFNLRADHPVYRDPAVRRALTQAIDRDAIVANQLDGLADRADAPIPAWSWAFNPVGSPATGYDPGAAESALTAAGWTRGDLGWTPKGASEPLQITIIGPDTATSASTWQVAEAIAADWRAIGLEVVHASLPAALLADRLRSGQFDLAVLAVNTGLDPDLYPLLASSQTTSGRGNLMGLQDPALDTLLAEARAPGTSDERTARYTALQERLVSQQYLIPIAYRRVVVAVSGAVEGPVSRPVSGTWDRFWDVLTWRLADGR